MDYMHVHDSAELLQIHFRFYVCGTSSAARVFHNWSLLAAALRLSAVPYLAV